MGRKNLNVFLCFSLKEKNGMKEGKERKGEEREGDGDRHLKKL